MVQIRISLPGGGVLDRVLGTADGEQHAPVVRARRESDVRDQGQPAHRLRVAGVRPDVLVLLPQLDRVVRGTFVRAARSSLGHARKGGEAGRTCEILRAIDGQDCPDGLLVSNKVVQQLEVLPYLCRPWGDGEQCAIRRRGVLLTCPKSPR